MRYVDLKSVCSLAEGHSIMYLSAVQTLFELRSNVLSGWYGFKWYVVLCLAVRSGLFSPLLYCFFLPCMNDFAVYVNSDSASRSRSACIGS